MHIEVINGLLGVGKTTFLLNLLKNKDKQNKEKIAVLVNEFGEIGIDGDLLSDQESADVVELPNGCICCTLTSDFRSQIKNIAETYKPDRLLIEPTGVATIKNLLGILGSLSLEKYIDDIQVVLIIDSSTFQETLMQNRGFVETQIEKAHRVVINKCDKVDPKELKIIEEIIRNINCNVKILLSTFGQVTESKIGKTNLEFKVGSKFKIEELGQEQALKKYEQFSQEIDGKYDLEKLRQFFENIQKDQYGYVDRAKGIFSISSDKWVHFDIASHELKEVAMKREFRNSKAIVIGTQLQKDIIKEELKKCLTMGESDG